jgi:hypothetical protein
MSKYFDQKNLFLEPQVDQYGSHMVMTDVAREKKIKYLTIDTRFRDYYDTSTVANYNISLPERVNSVRSMTLRSVELPISFYNISSQLQNNSFTVKNLLVEKTIVLDDNQYSESGTNPLGSAVETKLNASTLTWVQNLNVTYDTSTKKITIANTNAFNVDIIFDKADCDSGKGGLSPTESLMSKLGWILGFRLANYTIEAGSSITGEAIMDVHGPRYLYLIIDEFKNGNPHSFLGLSRTSQLSSQQILGRIVMDTREYPYGSINPVELGTRLVSDVRTYGELVNLQRLNVRIVDEFGRIMNLNGMDFSFCLELEHL